MRTPLPLLIATLVIAGCAGQPAPGQSSGSPGTTSSVLATPAVTSRTPTALGTPSGAPTPSVRTITIELKNGKASPNGSRVDLDRGEPFVLDITSDRDDEVHVHGFDKQIDVTAGKRVKVTMTADSTGRFEVESHHPELLIVVLQIR